MKNCKVKIEIVDNDSKVIGSIMINCETIKSLSEIHNISALDEAYHMLLKEIDKS